ncbi:MAG: TonB-dependent receptor [Rikenellaceae bacterium]
MKRVIFLFTLIITQAVVAFAANEEFVVRGHVLDAATNKHIPHATVAVVGTTKGAVADDTGHFYLKNLAVGNYTLRASMVGYTPVDKKISVKAGETLQNITFELTEDVLSVDQVVVSANRTEIKRKNSPAIVSVMPAELFKIVEAPTLAGGLSYQPGVRVEDNCQNCGFTQVRINGLDGHYSQILVDSRPMFSALTGVYGLEQIPANMVERVEVVRGGGSALFGSSAIGGTVNIITKTPEYNGGEVAHSLKILEGGKMDNNTTANVALVSDNQRAGLTLFGNVRNREGYDANGDGFTEISEIEASTFGLRSFLKTGDYTKLSLQYDYTDEYRRGGDMLDSPINDATIAETTTHKINGGGLNFDIFSKNYGRKLNLYASAQHTNRDSYYGGSEGGYALDEDGYTMDEDGDGLADLEIEEFGFTEELTVVTGAQFSQSWEKLWFMPAEFVGGVEYNYNKLEDMNFDIYDEAVSQKINTVGVYAQNEWRNDRFGLLLGLRADKHSMIDNVILSPRVNVRYNPSDKVNFRASYATGFRGPQAFDEDLHIAVVGGERWVTQLADDLKEEKSQSYSISADMYHNFGAVSTNLLIEGFYTALRDAFVVTPTGEYTSTGAMIQTRENGSGATVKGVSAEARVTLPRVVSFQASMTYQKSRYEEEEIWSEDDDVAGTKEMFRSPDWYGYITANVDLTQRLMLSLSGTYTGKMLVQHFAGAENFDVQDAAVRTQDFFDANLKLTYGFTLVNAVKMEVSAGVQNIFNSYQSDFDLGADRDAGYVYGPMSPRGYTLGAKLMF